MRVKYPLNAYRQIERLRAGCSKALEKIHIIAAVQRTRRLILSNDASLIPIPVRAAAVDPRRLNRSQLRD